MPMPMPVSHGDLRRHLFESVDLWNTSLHAVMRCGPDHDAEDGPPPRQRFHISYMPMRNRIEVPRLILEAAGAPYDFEVIGFRKWAEVKPTTPFGRTPVLHNFDGEGNDLAQEAAITRFLAKELKLSGASNAEEALCDMLYQQFFCTLRNNGLSHDGEHYSALALRDAASSPVSLESLVRSAPRYVQMRRVNNFTVAERSLAALRAFEEQLERTGTGYLVGSKLTYVDLAVFNILFELDEPDNVPWFASRFGLPRLGNLLKLLRDDHPHVSKYVRSEGRIPRYTRPGYVYCEGRFSSSAE